MAKATRDRVVTFRPDRETLEAMTRYRERVGVPLSVQIRMSLKEWLAARPEAWPDKPKASRKRRSQ